ncbi:MAG: ArgP/LysG family DNA-binding transcriptional regulator [Paracoccaceae bacterium]
MTRIDYDSLTILAAVVREGSFEAAAKSLSVTQSAVSQRIRQLEEKVGVLLVARGRPCVPTEAGLQFCRHMEQVTLLQQELAGRMRALIGGTDAQAATIRLAVNNDSLATWFPGLIKRATQELGIRFDILPDDQEHTEGSLKSGDALAVITTLETPVQGCRRISLGSMDYIAVAAPELFQREFAKGVSLDTLRDSICLAFNRKDTIQDQWMQMCFGDSCARFHPLRSVLRRLSCLLPERCGLGAGSRHRRQAPISSAANCANSAPARMSGFRYIGSPACNRARSSGDWATWSWKRPANT